MRNIKLIIEYDGTAYEGWQVQNLKGRTARTIQETICRALEGIVGGKVKLTGSGRTDAGVHALAQVANFHTASKIPVRNLQKALNSVLPDDIVITKAEEVDDDFHARYSAKWKLYRYTILNRQYPSAIRRNFVAFVDYPLSAAAMKREAAALKGRHDFRSFHAADNEEKSSVRTIRKIAVRKSGDDIVIEVEADGFLKNMVRTIAGTLIETGRGKFPAGSMKRILAAKDRRQAGPTAPASGLALVKVTY
ncbi:MAG: tRNA pseudouridine(38-40) synthase TruA [Deltaproteobacteria bacterium]